MPCGLICPVKMPSIIRANSDTDKAIRTVSAFAVRSVLPRSFSRKIMPLPRLTMIASMVTTISAFMIMFAVYLVGWASIGDWSDDHQAGLKSIHHTAYKAIADLTCGPTGGCVG